MRPTIADKINRSIGLYQIQTVALQIFAGLKFYTPVKKLE